jgi:excisionase family DNA binding protein
VSKPAALTVTVSQAAHMLGVSRSAGYDAARRGELPTIRIGRRLVVPRRALERMLEGNPEVSARTSPPLAVVK